MKKICCVMVVALTSLYLCASAQATEAEDSFLDAYKKASVLTHELFEQTSEVLWADDIGTDLMIGPTDKLLAHIKTLEQLVRKTDKEEAISEVEQMASYLKRLKHSIQTGEERDQAAVLLAQYYLHFNHLLMVNTITLKKILNDHLEELKAALISKDMHRIAHIAEHQYIHAEQMHYAAQIFGKKIWQKFSGEIKTGAEKIFEAARMNDMGAVAVGVNNIEKPVQMLMRIIKE